MIHPSRITLTSNTIQYTTSSTDEKLMIKTKRKQMKKGHTQNKKYDRQCERMRKEGKQLINVDQNVFVCISFFLCIAFQCVVVLWYCVVLCLVHTKSLNKSAVRVVGLLP